jgi:origin recognition complex subunit 1
MCFNVNYSDFGDVGDSIHYHTGITPETQKQTINERFCHRSLAVTSRVCVVNLKIQTMTTTPTTPRRSQRQQNQPARVPHHTKYALSSSQTNTWTGDPIRTRPAQVTDFLDSEEFDEEDPGVIRLYDSFTRRRKVKQVVRTYGKKQTRTPRSSDAGEAGGPNELFKIGDVVFVASETKKPSIAVVTDMWEVVYPDDDREGEDDKAERMKVRIHWFLRPEQLARIRQKRDHHKASRAFSALINKLIIL